MSDTKFAKHALLTGIVLAAALIIPGLSLAQDRDDDRYNPPPAGDDVGRDYLTDEYYTYQGPPPRDRRVGEQTGWRDGVPHTPPASFWRRCGCSSTYYHGRYFQRPDLYNYDERVYDDRGRSDRRAQSRGRSSRGNW